MTTSRAPRRTSLIRPISLAAALLAALCFSLPRGAAASASAPPIYVYYFHAPGCPHCDVTDRLVRDLARDPQLRVRALDIHTRPGVELAVALLVVAGQGSRTLPAAPSLLVGRTYVSMGRFTTDAVAAAVQKYRRTGAGDLLPGARRIQGRARAVAAGALRRWGLLPVLGAGLLDGVNPCALATLVFLMSYLAARGVRGRALWGAGLLFALGVFACYFALGCGLLSAVLALDALPALRRGLFLAAAAGCLVLAGVTVHDVRALRAGATRRVALQLPDALKRRIHGLIRGRAGGAWAGLGAVVAGAGVSVVELACTGQVYVPAIILLTGVSETRLVALAWLLLYCFCFVTPLLVLLALVACGTSAHRLAATATRQAALTKSLMALFFLLAAVFFAVRGLGL